MNRWTDGDPAEDGLARSLAGPLASLRSAGAGCPDPAVVAAARAGVLPDGLAAAVSEHLDRCRLCQALAADLADPELATPTRLEAARIRATVTAAAGDAGLRAGPGGWVRWLRPAAAAATLVAALAAGSWLFWGRSSPPGVAVSLPATVAERPHRLPLVKPPVIMPLTSVLVFRSQPQADRDRYLADVANALAAYRADEFAEAARRLDAIARTDATAEVLFYRGVCRLFLDQHDLALVDLQRARELASPALADEATWYLAVACDRLGRPEPAIAELRTLCAGTGEHRAQACEALAGFAPAGR
jgi:hypothetical protein